ncbi:MAG: pentapeptide repeat-containing protein [Methanosarcina sp.]
MEIKKVYEGYKKLKVPSLSEIHERASQHSKTSLVFIILFVVLLILALQCIPHYQIEQFNITNQKDLADAENNYRATLAQIFGGVAIAVGIYYTWRRITIAEEDLKATQENLKVTQENLKVSQEGQITERFTRAIEQLGAIDHLGNPAIEIRIGGIYALERIANESEKDYWPIMEIFTSYIRKNSRVETTERKKFENISMDTLSPLEIKNQKIRELPFDILAIITVIDRRKYSYENEENGSLDLSFTNLECAQFPSANLTMAYLNGADLTWANLNRSKLTGIILYDANLTGADLTGANLTKADLSEANFHNACLRWSNLTESNLTWANLTIALLTRANLNGANLNGANLTGADLSEANLKETLFIDAILEGANLEEANLENSDFEGAILIGAKNLTVYQLSKAKTLYEAKLDPELEVELKAMYPHLFEEPVD